MILTDIIVLVFCLLSTIVGTIVLVFVGRYAANSQEIECKVFIRWLVFAAIAFIWIVLGVNALNVL